MYLCYFIHIESNVIIPQEFEKEVILQAIEKYYDVKIPKNNGREQVKEFKVVGKAKEKYTDSQELKDDISVINHINEIITTAINEGASDIHFEPYENKFRVRYRMDGKLQEVHEL